MRRRGRTTRLTIEPPFRTARNSKPLEVIGTYDPVPKKDSYDESGKLHKDIRLDVDRAKYWIGVGAQPTDTVWRFLSMVRTPSLLCPSPPRPGGITRTNHGGADSGSWMQC